MRLDKRKPDELRPITLTTHYSRYAEGSALISCGNTQVLCNTTIEDRIPKWLQEQGSSSGWVTAEYAMLPRATEKRNTRETDGLRGRTQEIKRLIGRSLRQAVNLQLLGNRTCIIDCDVLQADGGTRALAITGGYVALAIALNRLASQGIIPSETLCSNVAAISVCSLNNEFLLDPCYAEDRMADLEANIVKSTNNQYIEIQVSAEHSMFSPNDLNELLSMAGKGIEQLIEIQNNALNQKTQMNS